MGWKGMNVPNCVMEYKPGRIIRQILKNLKINLSQDTILFRGKSIISLSHSPVFQLTCPVCTRHVISVGILLWGTEYRSDS